MTNIPAGWYPDPSGSGQQRWWNGVSWTENFAPAQAPAYAPAAPQPYSMAQPLAAVPTAPAGTSPYTPWIWILAALPVFTIITTIVSWLATDVDDLLSPGADATGLGITPIDVLTSGIAWLVIGLTVLFAILDYRELGVRGVEKPFHWAWVFFVLLSAPVYVVGRSIIIRRRTGSGLAPMWLNIGLLVLAFIISVVFSVSLFTQVFSEIPMGA